MTGAGPYRTSEAPARPKKGGGLAGTVLGLVLLHAAFAVVFLLLTPVLRWVGPNGVIGLGMRIVGTLVTIGAAWLVVLVLLQAWGGTRSLILAGVLFVGWWVMFIGLLDREHAYLLIPRAGDMNLETVGWIDSLICGLINCALSGIIAVLLALKPLWTSIEAEKSRLIVANLEPCPRCGGRWELDGKLKRCAGCGNETAAPTAEEVRAIRGG